MDNIIGNRAWINEWENRENGKSENQKEKDEKLYEAANWEKWDEVEKLLNEGATPDYVEEDGVTAYYWTLFMAKEWNDEGAKKVLEKFDQKWKNEIEKEWTIRMAREEYLRAAEIINFTGKTEIVTNSKHPIIAILRMMGKCWLENIPWKEEYSRKIMKELNLKPTLQTDLNFMLENKITESEEFKKNFPNLSKILKEFSFDIQYDESNRKFANFSLTYSELNEQIGQLSDENANLTTEIQNLKNVENSENRRLKEDNEKLRSEESELRAEIQNLKNVQRTDRAKFSSEISQLKNQIKKLENDLEEKLFIKPSKEQHREIEELFIKSRNAQHNIANYKIQVNIRTKRFFLILIYFFRKFVKSTTKNY